MSVTNPRQMLLDARRQRRIRYAINVANGQAGTKYHLDTVHGTPEAILAVGATYINNVGVQTKEIQNIVIGGDPDGGTFTLTVTNPITGVAGTTDPIDFDANASEIQAALEALDDDVVIAGEITVGASTGSSPNLTWPCTFNGRFAQANPGAMTANAAALTDGGSHVDETVTINTATPYAASADTVSLKFGITRKTDADTGAGTSPAGALEDDDAIATLAVPNGVLGDEAVINTPAGFASTLKRGNTYPEAEGFPVVLHGYQVWFTLAEDLASGPSGTIDVWMDVAAVAHTFSK